MLANENTAAKIHVTRRFDRRTVKTRVVRRDVHNLKHKLNACLAQKTARLYVSNKNTGLIMGAMTGRAQRPVDTF